MVIEILLGAIAEAIMGVLIEDLTQRKNIANWRTRLSGDSPEKLAVQRALEKACAAFNKEYPELSNSFFDEHYLQQPQVVVELAKILTPNRSPDKTTLTQYWEAQFSSKPNVDLQEPLAYFLDEFEKEVKSEPALKGFIDSREVTTQPAVLIKPASPPSLATSPSDTVPKIQPGSILIVVATKTEAQAVLEAFSQAAGKRWTRRAIGNKTYYNLGIHGGAPVYMVQSEAGTATPGGALLTVRQAIQDLRPQAVIMCGFAFGLRPDKQKFGEILVAKQLLFYEPQKVDLKQGQIPRGDRTTSAERLLDRFRSGDNDWQGAPTHFGLVVSGEKLVNDPDFRDWLLKTEPEAIGGEMEGGGLYVAARDAKVDWILVKAICDWGDGKKDDAAQALAACNAAQFVLHVLQLGGWDGPEQLRRELYTVSTETKKQTTIQEEIRDLLSERLELRSKVATEYGVSLDDLAEKVTSALPSYKSSDKAIENVRNLRHEVEVLEEKITLEDKLTLLKAVYLAWVETGKSVFEIKHEIAKEWGFDTWKRANVAKYLVGRGFLLDETPDYISSSKGYTRVRLTQEGADWYRKHSAAPLFEANGPDQQTRLDASSINLYPHKNPPYNAAKMLYTGTEIAKDLDVRIIYQDPDGTEQAKVIEEFFPEQDSQMIWRHYKYDFLKPDQVVYFRLPRRKSVFDGRVIVSVSFVGANSGVFVKVEKKFELQQ